MVGGLVSLAMSPAVTSVIKSESAKTNGEKMLGFSKENSAKDAASKVDNMSAISSTSTAASEELRDAFIRSSYKE